MNFRMPGKWRVIRAWYKQHQEWSQLVEYKCEQDVRYVAIWQKFMQCIGAVIPGNLNSPLHIYHYYL